MNIWLSKKLVRVGSHTICLSLNKRLVSIGRKKCSKNTIAVPRNMSITSRQVIDRGFTRMSPKVNSSRQPNPTTVARAWCFSKQIITYFFGKAWHVAIISLEQWKTGNSEWHTQPFVCQLSSKKSGKPTAKGGSLFTTTMWDLTHRLKQLHFWELKISFWWVIRRIVLTWHRMTSS